MALAFAVFPQRAPYSGEIRGYTVKAALRNNAGKDGGVSFARGYLQAEYPCSTDSSALDTIERLREEEAARDAASRARERQ